MMIADRVDDNLGSISHASLPGVRTGQRL